MKTVVPPYEDSVKPCKVSLLNVVEKVRSALIEGVEEQIRLMLGQDGARMRSAIQTIKEFGREDPSKIAAKHDDPDTSADSDVMIVDVEMPAPAPVKPPPRLPTVKKTYNRPHRTPDRASSATSVSSLSEIPFKRMTERQVVLESLKQSPAATSTPMRLEDPTQTVKKEERIARPGEVVEQQSKTQLPQKPKTPKIKPKLLQNSATAGPQSSSKPSVNGEVSNKKPKLKQVGIRSGQPTPGAFKTPSSRDLKPSQSLSSDNKNLVVPEKPSAEKQVSNQPDITLRLKKVATQIDGSAVYMPKSDPQSTTNIDLPPDPLALENGDFVFHDEADALTVEIPPPDDNIFSRMSPGAASESTVTQRPIISSITEKSANPSGLVRQKSKSPVRSMSNGKSSSISEKPKNESVTKKHKLCGATDLSNEKKPRPSTTSNNDDEEAGDDLLTADPDELRAKICRKKEIIAGLKKKLEDERKKFDSRAKEFSQSEKKLKGLEAELVSVRGNFLTLSQSGPKKVASANCGCQCNLADDELKKMQTEIDQFNVVNEQLNRDLSDRNELLSSATARVDMLTEECKDLRKKLDSNMKNLQEFEKKCQAAVTSRESYRTQISSLHRVVEKLQGDLKERDARIAEISSSNPSSKSGENDVSEKLASVDSDNYSALVKQLKADLFRARRECIERGEIISELQQELSGMSIQRPSSQLEDDLTEALTKNDRYECEIAFLSGKKRELELEADTVKIQLENLKDELLRQILNRDLPLKLKEYTYQSKVDSLTQQIENMKRQQASNSG